MPACLPISHTIGAGYIINRHVLFTGYNARRTSRLVTRPWRLAIALDNNEVEIIVKNKLNPGSIGVFDKTTMS